MCHSSEHRQWTHSTASPLPPPNLLHRQSTLDNNKTWVPVIMRNKCHDNFFHHSCKWQLWNKKICALLVLSYFHKSACTRPKPSSFPGSLKKSNIHLQFYKLLKIVYQIRNYLYRGFCQLPCIKKYKVVQIWPGQTVTCLHTNSPGHIWTTL